MYFANRETTGRRTVGADAGGGHLRNYPRGCTRGIRREEHLRHRVLGRRVRVFAVAVEGRVGLVHDHYHRFGDWTRCPDEGLGLPASSFLFCSLVPVGANSARRMAEARRRHRPDSNCPQCPAIRSELSPDRLADRSTGAGKRTADELRGRSDFLHRRMRQSVAEHLPPRGRAVRPLERSNERSFCESPSRAWRGSQRSG
jgi:hypothetical protein